MALQTLPASLTANQPAATGTTGTASSGDPASDLNSRNSVPFSFLIAFLALFVVFMAMGLWARKVNHWMRRRLGLPIPEPRLKRPENKPKKPVIWDVYPESAGDGTPRWGSIQPLSSWYRQQMSTFSETSVESGDMPASRNPREYGPLVFGVAPGRGGLGRGTRIAPSPPRPPRPPRQQSSNSSYLSLLCHALLRPFPIRRRQEQPPTRAEHKTEALQVAVFVALPSQDSKRRGGCGETFRELSLGIAEMPWNRDDPILDDS